MQEYLEIKYLKDFRKKTVNWAREKNQNDSSMRITLPRMLENKNLIKSKSLILDIY